LGQSCYSYKQWRCIELNKLVARIYRFADVSGPSRRSGCGLAAHNPLFSGKPPCGGPGLL
jgi:hypothetical protein